MSTPLTEHARACSWVIAPERKTAQAPYQLPLLSFFPEGASDFNDARDEHRVDQAHGTPARRRICRALTAADVAPFDGNRMGSKSCPALLQGRTGPALPGLYARASLRTVTQDTTGNAETFTPADANLVVESAMAILHHRLRRGVKILRDPTLLLRFLQLRLVSQPRPVFAVFFLDRHQQLIRFVELFHGQGAMVTVHPREVVRDALACNAEKILCVRSDPHGNDQPTPADAEDALRVTRAMNLLNIPVLDYVIVGRSVTSLRARGVLRI